MDEVAGARDAGPSTAFDPEDKPGWRFGMTSLGGGAVGRKRGSFGFAQDDIATWGFVLEEKVREAPVANS